MKEVKINRISSFIIFFTSVLTFFLLGVFFADKVKDLYVKNILKSDVSKIIFQERLDVFGRKDLDLEDFWETYNLMRANFYGISDIEKEKLVEGAIAGLVDALDDQHSEYMDKKETEQFNKVLSGDFEGIGAVVNKVDIGIEIERVLKGSPAKEYGIRVGDIVIEANGEELDKLGLYEAVEKIKGPAGTDVLLKILRSGEKDFLEIKVIRDKIKIPSVEGKELEETPYYYISLNMFGDTTVSEFKIALNEAKNYEGLIIDLRDNGGGYLQSAVEILSNFIDDGKILVTTKYKDNINNLSYKSINDGDVFDKKIVVLINGNSASASEITAGALREYNKTILIGEKSYGKGSVQQPFNYSNGALLKLTIAKWFTPKDKNIDGEGIDPDIEVEFKEEDYENKYDRQLEEAKKLLEIYIKEDGIGIALDRYNSTKKEEVEETE